MGQMRKPTQVGIVRAGLKPALREVPRDLEEWPLRSGFSSSSGQVRAAYGRRGSRPSMARE